MKIQRNKNRGIVSAAEPCADRETLHLSFAGGAVQSFFNVGVASWMIKHMKRDEFGTVYGVSGGALCGAWLLCASDSAGFQLTTSQYIKEWEEKVNRLGGRRALRGSLDYHRSLLERHLPKNAHEVCSGHLTIGLTNVRTWKLENISHFETRDFLIDVLIATMTIPFVNALIPSKVGGERYIDGGFVQNQIVCCEEALVCSPFRRLRMPWTARGVTPKRCILGERPLLSALNPFSDVRDQVESGFAFAQRYFEAPHLASAASELGTFKLLERLSSGVGAPVNP